MKDTEQKVEQIRALLEKAREEIDYGEGSIADARLLLALSVLTELVAEIGIELESTEKVAFFSQE